MTKPADLLTRAGVFLIRAFFESSDEHHHPKPVAFYSSYRFRHGLGYRFGGGDPFYNFVGNSHLWGSRR